jgi:hypothetical protein
MVAISIDTAPPEANTTPVTCGADVALPSPGSGCAAANQVCAPKGVTLDPSSSSVIFDPLGRSVTAAKALAGNLSIRVSNQPDITIAQESGWVQ